MRNTVVEVSTEVFHLLQDRAPEYVAWLEEKAGPTQKILLEPDVYSELIDRAIAHRRTLDGIFRELCAGQQKRVVRGPGAATHLHRQDGMR